MPDDPIVALFTAPAGDVCTDRLREAQELIYAAQSALKQSHWQVVAKSTEMANSILEAVRQEAITQLGRERKP